jgi:hypothetical protein
MTAVAAVPGFDSAKTPILLLAGGLAIDESDIERCPGRGRAIHEDSEAIIVRRDFAEHARDGRRSSSNTGKAAGEKAAAMVGSDAILIMDMLRLAPAWEPSSVFRRIPRATHRDSGAHPAPTVPLCRARIRQTAR